jgi:hypothetical protein
VAIQRSARRSASWMIALIRPRLSVAPVTAASAAWIPRSLACVATSNDSTCGVRSTTGWSPSAEAKAVSSARRARSCHWYSVFRDTCAT